MKLAVGVVLCFVAMLSLYKTSYADDAQKKKLIGNWQSLSDGDITEFFEDGTFIIRQMKMKISDPRRNISGKWVMLSDGRIKMEISVLGTPHVVMGRVTFEKDEMIMEGED